MALGAFLDSNTAVWMKALEQQPNLPLTEVLSE